jgi:hypothetical protein
MELFQALIACSSHLYRGTNPVPRAKLTGRCVLPVTV